MVVGGRGLRLPRGRAADAALAGAVYLPIVVTSVVSWIFDPHDESWAATAAGWILITVACGALYFSRRRPVAVAIVVLAATSAYYLSSVYDGPLMVALIVALYVVAAEGRLQAAVSIAALVVIAVGAGTLAGNHDVNGVAVFMLAGWLVAVVALGWLRHNRLAYLREVERRAAGEERLRIAHELHDVVGHHLSLITVQAGTALHRFKRDPAQAETALAAIKDSGREALRDLRTTLGMLRQTGDEVPTAPAPSLRRIGDLARSARLAGVDVRTDIAGADAPLPTAVDLAVYRIVQESLTNVARHAHAGTATVRVERRAGELVIEVADDGRGPGPGAAESGSGIAGMRERARALGGELTAGPGQSGGFVVRARLPYQNGTIRPS
jgi:signal transduction histidine kinase